MYDQSSLIKKSIKCSLKINAGRHGLKKLSG